MELSYCIRIMKVFAVDNEVNSAISDIIEKIAKALALYICYCTGKYE